MSDSIYALDINAALSNTGAFFQLFKPEYTQLLYRPQKGPNSIRILPPSKFVREQYKNFGIPVARHFAKGTARDGAYLCLSRNNDLLDALHVKDRTCGFCQKQAKLQARYGFGKVPKEENCYASISLLVWLVDRLSTSPSPKLWLMPMAKVARAIGFQSIDDSGKPLAVTDPKEGYGVKFQMESLGGSAMMVSYEGVMLDRNPTPISTNPESVKKYVKYIEEHSLEKTLNIPTQEDLKKLFAFDVSPVVEEDVDADFSSSVTSPTDKEVEWVGDVHGEEEEATPVETATEKVKSQEKGSYQFNPDEWN